MSVGEVDATVMNLAVATYLINKNNLANLKVASPADIDLPGLSFAVRKDWPELVTIFNKALATVTPEEESVIRNKWVSVTYKTGIDVVLALQVGGVVAIIIVIIVVWNRRLGREVAERKRVEEALRNRTQLVQLLAHIAQDANQASHLKDAVLKALTDVCTYSGWPIGHAYIRSADDSGLLVPSGIWHLDDPERFTNFVKITEATTFETGVGLPGRVFASGKPAWIPDIAKDPNFPRAASGDDIGVKAAFACPVLLRSRVVAVLEFFTTEFVKPDEILLDALLQIGTQLGRVAERERAEEALVRQTDLLNNVLESASQGIVAYDGDHRIVAFNKNYTPIWRLPESLMKAGARLHDVVYRLAEKGVYGEGDPKTQAEERIVKISSGEASSADILGADGNMYHALSQPTKDGGLVLTYTDITERNRAQDMLTEAKEQAETASRAKSDFLATMSHEIRTPMNAVLGMAYLALKTELTRKQKDYVTKILSAGESLLAVINDLLDFSKIEAGKLPMERIGFLFDAVLENVSVVLGQKARDKGLEFLFSTAPDVPQHLYGDPLRLGQVLINLVGNSVKFTEKGEIVLTCRVARKEEKRVKLKFSVRDTGIGMTPDQIDRLFTAFSQADTSITRRYGGTGLGLSISKRLVEMMDGEVQVDSAPGEGSTFTFTAWFGHADADREDAMATRLTPNLRGMRVLVVDDNETAREILREVLEAMTFDVTTVPSAEAALDTLRDADEPYPLVVMDWNMPGGIDGVQATRRIKHEPGIEKPPAVIMVTASGRDELREQAEDAGADGFILKPINQSILFDTLMDVFGGRGEPGGTTSLAPRWAAEAEKSLAATRVLLVEDNKINQQVAVEILEGAGASVAVADNGLKAVTLLLDSDEPPPFDVALMDLQMPEMDGYEATRRIRQDTRFTDFPIIAMTAHGLVEELQNCLAVGMNDHVIKPIHPDTLFATIRRWLPDVGPADLVAPPPPATKDTEPLPDVPGLNVGDGLARVLGNRKTYERVLTLFQDNHADDANAVERAVEDGNWELADQLAHTLKGVAGNIGAEAVFEAAMALEKAIGEREESAVRPALTKTKECVQELLASLANVLAQMGATSDEADPVANSETLATGLEKLGDLLSDNDGEAVEFWNEIRSELAITGGSPELTKLNGQIQAFEFEAALHTLSELKDV